MANEYTPTVWRTGDVITAEKLNKIEEGIANAGGGESDFSIANVIINWSDLGISELSWDNCPSIVDNFFSDDNSEMINGITYADSSPATIKVPLFDGVCFWERSTMDWIVTGDIEISEDGFKITGDGTITFVPK